MTTPALSVVMSAYNAQRYLREAVDSVLRQTFRDFELVVIDDGSKDSTRSILAEYEDRDNRVKVISRANKGLTVSLNEGLSHAKAPLIARMDADDVCLPQRFEKQVAFLKANPNVVLVGSRVELIDPYGVHIGNVDYPADHAAITAGLLNGEGGIVPHPAAIYRAEAVRRVGGYREQFNNSEDLDLWLRLGEVGEIANLPEILLQYRRDLGSVSHTKRDNQLRLKSIILAEAYDRRGLPKPAEWKFDTWHPKPHDEQLKAWGWKALHVGRKDAARGHAKSLLKLKPFSIDSWRLMFCAWRGR
jgi:glycosyltransferase involved in cell wall biosynthesis